MEGKCVHTKHREFDENTSTKLIDNRIICEGIHSICNTLDDVNTLDVLVFQS